MPNESETTLTVGEGAKARRIAYRRHPGTPGVVWLIGLKSDMRSTKAEALAQWTAARGMGFTAFDYSGHGASDGPFEAATLSDWLEEAAAVFMRATQGPQILAGSSTGGHVALMLLRHLMAHHPDHAARIKGLVLIAPAWDLTDLMWSQLADSARAEILEKGEWRRPSAYDPAGYPITRRFIEDGEAHRFEGASFNPARPVLVLQGALDPDVPLAHATRLADVLAGDWVRMTVVPDGEHRLSRPEDIEKLFALVAQLA